MPRPSVKDERQTTILDAYERCITRLGVEGTTLEQVAKEAGLARALIRHNVGNKDALLDACISRFLERSRAESRTLFETLPERHRVSALLDVLFDARYADTMATRTASALMAASHSRPQLAEKMRAWFDQFIDDITDELSANYSASDAADIRDVATAIAALYSSVDAMTALGPMPALRASSLRAAKKLLDGLR